MDDSLIRNESTTPIQSIDKKKELTGTGF